MSRGRTKYTWFPNVGSTTGVPGQVYSGLIVNNLPVPANSSGSAGGPINSLIIPVVQDEPLEPEEGGNQAGQLARILGQEYILERIVGSCFVGAASLSQTESAGPRAVLVTCGFFVARADASDGNASPVGSNNVTENFAPLNVENVREPWIWRRTWLLGPESDVTQPLTFAPSFNGFYGSVMDGPHIDARSVRRVGNDDRLWFIISCMSVSVNDDRDGIVQAVIDYRVLGKLVKAHNKSAF